MNYIQHVKQDTLHFEIKTRLGLSFIHNPLHFNCWDCFELWKVITTRSSEYYHWSGKLCLSILTTGLTIPLVMHI